VLGRSYSVCRSKMRHLICVCFYEGWAGRGARNIVTADRMHRQPVEPIDKAQKTGERLAPRHHSRLFHRRLVHHYDDQPHESAVSRT
jgi:hypothetical protein